MSDKRIPFSPLPLRAVLEEAPPLQHAAKRAKLSDQLVLLLTPVQNRYCGYALQESAELYDELPVTSFSDRVNSRFTNRVDKVVLYCDEGVNGSMRALQSLALSQGKPVELRLLNDANHAAWQAASTRSQSDSATLADSSSGKSV
jgi:hypothetical protein